MRFSKEPPISNTPRIEATLPDAALPGGEIEVRGSQLGAVRSRLPVAVLDGIAAPVLLREPSEDELNSSVVSDAYGGHDGCVKKAISNRLAQYTVAPDPRREALKKYMIKKYLWQSIADEDADGLLAAIDAAKESQ